MVMKRRTWDHSAPPREREGGGERGEREREPKRQDAASERCRVDAASGQQLWTRKMTAVCISRREWKSNRTPSPVWWSANHLTGVGTGRKSRSEPSPTSASHTSWRHRRGGRVGSRTGLGTLTTGWTMARYRKRLSSPRSFAASAKSGSISFAAM